MEFVPTPLAEVIEVVPRRFGDERGWFSEVYKRPEFEAAGVDVEFVQDNQSFSATSGTLRGLHYQVDPHGQAKLVSVLRGAVLDVAVDIRRSSPTFGEHVAVELSAEAGNQLFVPVGFAHGFITLVPDVHVAYKVSDRYAPECERSIRWDDPDLAIAWPDVGGDPVLSDKDAAAPGLAEQPDLF